MPVDFCWKMISNPKEFTHLDTPKQFAVGDTLCSPPSGYGHVCLWHPGCKLTYGNPPTLQDLHQATLQLRRATKKLRIQKEPIQWGAFIVSPLADHLSGDVSCWDALEQRIAAPQYCPTDVIRIMASCGENHPHPHASIHMYTQAGGRDGNSKGCHLLSFFVVHFCHVFICWMCCGK